MIDFFSRQLADEMFFSRQLANEILWRGSRRGYMYVLYICILTIFVNSLRHK